MSRKPLAGRTIAITRPKDQARSLARMLSRAGAKVIVAPLIRIAAPSSYVRLDAAIRGLAAFDCIVFTSHNAVKRFFGRNRRQRSLRLEAPKRVFAIGPQTARSLRKEGWHPRGANARRSEELAASIKNIRGSRILLPRSAIAREALPTLLRQKGARVCAVTAYRTLTDPSGAERLKKAARSRLDAVIFSSPSAVDVFFRRVGRRSLAKAAAVSIGPITSAALKARGIKPVEAKTPTPAALVAALAAHFHEKRA